MGKVIPLPAPGSRSLAERSGGSTGQGKGISASVSRLQSRRPRIQEEFGPAVTTSPPSGIRYPGPGPCRQGNPRSRICPEALALTHSFMDDKSMQAWINEQLTSGGPPRTIVVVGRPKETTSPTTYRAQFFKRVRAARALYTENPPEMAKALGVPRDTYYRYEERTMLPHHLIPKFCEITGVTVDWLMRGPAAAQAMQHQKTAATG
jgi:hypothetical protein